VSSKPDIFEDTFNRNLNFTNYISVCHFVVIFLLQNEQKFAYKRNENNMPEIFAFENDNNLFCDSKLVCEVVGVRNM
jgi:hypothetical protein